MTDRLRFGHFSDPTYPWEVPQEIQLLGRQAGRVGKCGGRADAVLAQWINRSPTIKTVKQMRTAAIGQRADFVGRHSSYGIPHQSTERTRASEVASHDRCGHFFPVPLQVRQTLLPRQVGQGLGRIPPTFPDPLQRGHLPRPPQVGQVANFKLLSSLGASLRTAYWGQGSGRPLFWA